jgi:hypothetical protein
MLLVVANNNILSNNIVNINKYVGNESIISRVAGRDERYHIKEEVTEEKLLEIYFKDELLQKLVGNQFHNEDKIDLMNKMPIIMDNIQMNDYKPFKMNNGGLLNDWNFEEF